MYIGAEESAVWRPRYVLKDFRKICLAPGEKRQVFLSCTLQDMAYYNEEKKAFVIEDIPYQVYVGTSSAATFFIKLNVLFWYMIIGWTCFSGSPASIYRGNRI